VGRDGSIGKDWKSVGIDGSVERGEQNRRDGGDGRGNDGRCVEREKKREIVWREGRGVAF
jgi:hypothetical protein